MRPRIDPQRHPPFSNALLLYMIAGWPTRPARTYASKEESVAVKPIPDGFHTVTPYLVVEGVPRLIEFLQGAFGAQETERSVDKNGRVMHAQVKIGDSQVMLGEAMEGHPPRPGLLYVYVPDTDAVYAHALAAGGVSLLAPADQFYGDRNAGVKDPCGNQWWIATHVEDVPAEELARRAAQRG
jgi:PhnB protein